MWATCDDAVKQPKQWSGRLDLNQRPHGPETHEYRFTLSLAVPPCHSSRAFVMPVASLILAFPACFQPNCTGTARKTTTPSQGRRSIMVAPTSHTAFSLSESPTPTESPVRSQVQALVPASRRRDRDDIWYASLLQEVATIGRIYALSDAGSLKVENSGTSCQKGPAVLSASLKERQT